VSPLDSILDISNNIITGDYYKDNIFGIKANGTSKQICLWSMNLKESNLIEL
jgi:hypothetical protein